jgi:predicted extracellular nuclease
LGALQSGSVSSTLSASFVNTTGKVVYTAQIQFTGEQWRLGTAGREDRLDFEYSQDGGTTWVEANALDFVAPVTTGTSGALDGNAAANSRAVSATLTGLNLAAGASLQVRWKDFNATSSDDGLAIDDVSVTLSSAWSAAPVITVPAVLAKINAIQGEGASSTMVGQSVIVEARITAVLPNLSMFYVQEETVDQDGNPLTSEGLAVYYGSSNPGVTADNVGDVVRLTGTVTEFNGMTQLTSPTAFSVVTDGTAASLDAAVQVKLPIASGTTLERFEGMLIEVSANSGSDLYVADTYTFARYGETTLYADAVPYQFTEQNAPSVSGNAAYQDALLRNRIQIEDGRSSENPTLAELNAGTRILRDTSVDGVSNGTALGVQDGTGVNFIRAGDTAESVTGVLGYSFGQYELQPTQTVNLTASVRPTGSPDVGAADVKVASFNLLNYFTTLGNANFTTPAGNSIAGRGATTADEFTQQQAKIVEAIVATGAHVLGLNELQNNGSADGSAIDSLVDALNARVGSTKFAYVSGHATGSDAIRVGLIYDQTVVKTQGNAQTPDTATYTAFAANNRIPVAQTFSYLNDDAKQFTVVVNHLKSKGSAASLAGDADAGDGQGFSNATRLAAANNLVNWLETNPTGTASDKVILLGDLNAYRKEDPIVALENAGFTHHGASTDYSYVYDGLRGSLDHVMTNGLSTAEVTGVVHFNINSDEQEALDYNDEFGDGSVMKDLDRNDMYKSSDHDPVVIGLKLDSALAVGDVRFMAANADSTDAFAFVVLKAVSVGTSIGFTDRDYSQANGMPVSGESALMWTADRAYEAGTVVTIQPDVADGTNPTADKGTVQGEGGGIGASGETIYAFLGNIAELGNDTVGAITLNTLLASINVGGAAAGDVPTAITSTSVSFTEDNVKYNGAMDFTNINTFVTQLNNTANWVTSDSTAYTLTNNSLFGV